MAVTFVEPEAHPPTWNVLLYGPAGTGKSVAAASAPGPVLYLNGEGPGALFYARRMHGNDKIREVAFEVESTLDEFYFEAQTGKYATVAVDTVGEIHKALLAAYGGDRPSLQQHGDVNLKMERFVRALRDLPTNVVLLAHEQIDDSEGEQVRRPQTGGRKLPEAVMAMVDIVAYTGVVAATDTVPARYVGQVVPTQGRRAKDRSAALDDGSGVRDLDITEWIVAASTAVAGEDKPKKTERKKAA